MDTPTCHLSHNPAIVVLPWTSQKETMLRFMFLGINRELPWNRTQNPQELARYYAVRLATLFPTTSSSFYSVLVTLFYVVNKTFTQTREAQKWCLHESTTTRQTRREGALANTSQKMVLLTSFCPVYRKISTVYSWLWQNLYLHVTLARGSSMWAKDWKTVQDNWQWKGILSIFVCLFF